MGILNALEYKIVKTHENIHTWCVTWGVKCVKINESVTIQRVLWTRLLWTTSEGPQTV